MSAASTPREFELKIWIGAPPRDVFASWVRSEQLARWFQHMARAFAPERPHEDKHEAAAGDHYEWRLNHGHRSTGRYLDVRPDELLVRLSFGGDSGMSTEFRAEPGAGGTTVHLTHRGLPPDDVETYADVKCGWTFYLANLKAYHEHGVDLREHDADRIRGGAMNV
jgi:uncharacterized protein YndB with AHSA1/START domain